MRVFVLCDDYWHPGRVTREGLGAMPAAAPGGDFSFDFIDDAGQWSREGMAGYPVVILSKSNNVSAANQEPWMTDAVQAAFVEYVREGGGLLAMHSGTAGYAETPLLRALLGGVFAHHPEQCPVTVQPRAGHPLTTGSAPFTRQDEHYHMTMDDPNADVFLDTVSEHGTQPGGWTREEGAGRVCVLTPGHNVEVWTDPSFQALIGNALRWCGKE